MERTPEAGLQNVSSPADHAFRAIRSRAVRDRTDVAGMAAQARIGADPASGFTMSIPAESFLSALQVFAAHERMDPLMLLCKLTEECGELAEAVLVERGFKPHKKLEPEAAIAEAADVLLCMLLVLSRLYPGLTPEQLATRLSQRADEKLARYVARQPALRA